MEWSKDWFQIVITVLGAALVIYWKFFDRNNDVFKLHIINIKDTIDRIVKEFKEDREELKQDIKGNAANIQSLTTSISSMTTQWSEMSNKYDQERKELKRQNDLLEVKNQQSKELIEFQKKEFQETIHKLATNTYEVLEKHASYEKRSGAA